MAMTNAQILQAIKTATKSQALKDFITNHPNLESFSNIITSSDFVLERNELISTIVNGIAMRIVNSKIMQNKLKELKGSKIPWGSQIEEIIANPAKSNPYDMKSTNLLTQTYPDVKSVYYKINRQARFDLTISVMQLQRALITPDGLSELVQMCVNTLYSGDNIEEMQFTKQLVGSALLNKRIKKVVVGEASDISAMVDDSPLNTIDTLTFANGMTKNEKIKMFVTKVRELFYNFTFPTSIYNAYDTVKEEDEASLIRDCDTQDQVLLLRTDILASTDVELLATAFNMDKATFLQKVIPVDDFNGFDAWAILCDKAWFKIKDTYYGLEEFRNGSNLTHNYWLHHHQILQYNLLSNAVVFLDAKDKTLNRGE